ncbi:hypothetical protein A2U01_0100206, partial [Trifolium medium]|nr:hypothetical protein [Trifolium medium]
MHVSRDVKFICKWGFPRGLPRPVWGSEDGEFFPVGMEMEEKVPPKRDLGMGT